MLSWSNKLIGLAFILSCLPTKIGFDSRSDRCTKGKYSAEGKIWPAILNCIEHPFVEESQDDAENLKKGQFL